MRDYARVVVGNYCGKCPVDKVGFVPQCWGMDYRSQLILLAETHASATGRSVARTATLIFNDGKFFSSLESGRACSVDNYLKAKIWFSTHWPASRPWPVGVARPGVLPDEEPFGAGHLNTTRPDAAPMSAPASPTSGAIGGSGGNESAPGGGVAVSCLVSSGSVGRSDRTPVGEGKP